MVPDTVLKPGLFFLFCAITLTVFFSPTGETSPLVQGFKTPGYCMSDSGGSVVYFSAIYDTKLNQPVHFSSNVIEAEFSEYLKGRYEFKAAGNFPAGCPLFGNLGQAEASKRKFEAQAQQANKQVVQTDWKYVVDPDLVAASYSNQGEDVVAVVSGMRKPTHTYCLADSVQGTLYTAGPVDTGMSVNLSLWNRGFDQHLREKYSFKGQVYCNIGRQVNVGRLMAARITGARAAGKKIVDTGWKYDASAVATAAPPKRDDDPEPVQRPAPPNPSRQASDIALKEMPESLAYCRRDPVMSAVFICDSFARVVYNYRMAHLNEPKEPVATLVAAHKLNCAECIDNTRVSFWVSDRAAKDKLSPQATNCVSQNVIVTLYKTPEPTRLNEFYKQAIATCNKQ